MGTYKAEKNPQQMWAKKQEIFYFVILPWETPWILIFSDWRFESERWNPTPEKSFPI
jgi:hypothetical protein